MRGKERFGAKEHELLPKRVSQWQQGLDQVDFSRPSPDDQARIGLWLPEAEFLVAVENPFRLFVYLQNWLHFRLPLMKLLKEENRFVPPRAPMWRILLERFPSTSDTTAERNSSGKAAKKHKAKLDACAYFSKLFNEEVPLHPAPGGTIIWRTHTMDQRSFQGSKPPESARKPIGEIAWELSEMGFRVDLYEADYRQVPPPPHDTVMALDDMTTRRALVTKVWPDGHFLFPTTPACPTQGLWAENIRDRACALDGLRCLFRRWPAHPASFDTVGELTRATDVQTLEQFERAAIRYYCQQFFEMFGRAPVVPRVLP